MSLSIEDCETQTLIRSVYLESMESGDFDQLPSFIQGRGMLNNYATFLGLDTEKLMLKFADALQLLSQEKARAALSQSSKNKEKTYKPVKKAGKFRQFFTPDLFIGVFVILGMAFVIGYSFYTISRYRRNVSTTPTVDLNEIFIEQLNESTSAPVFLSTATSTPGIMALNHSEDENQEDENAIDENSPVQLFIAANQRSYLKVISDGKDAFSGRTLPGNTYPFDAQNLIEVIVGNADAVSFTYNQQNIGKLGKLGEVLDLQFGPYTVITPTPQFSPTPTLTLQPTYTSVPETPIPTLTPTPYIP